jgi:hypothetical protein
MCQSLVSELTIRADCVPIEVAENGGGGEAIETIIVEIYLHHPHTFQDIDVHLYR